MEPKAQGTTHNGIVVVNKFTVSVKMPCTPSLHQEYVKSPSDVLENVGAYHYVSAPDC
jgi:hypothetical protein